MLAFPTIWIGSRSGLMKYIFKYRDDDKGFNFGSSINNDDLAKGNIIKNNKPNSITIRNWEI